MLKTKLLPYQLEGSQFLLDAKAAILGDGMGLGKTIQAINTADTLRAKTLIVCPTFLIDNWKNEIIKFVSHSDASFTVASYDQITKSKMEVFKPFDYVVADEAHYLKSMSAQRTIAFHERLMNFPPKNYSLLTGTAIKNRVQELYSLLVLLSYHPAELNKNKVTDLYPTEELFCEKFSYADANGYGVKYKGLRNLSTLKKLLKGKYLRRNADEVLDLPPLLFKPVFVKMKQPKNLWNDFESSQDDSSKLSRAKLYSAISMAKFTATYTLNLLEQTNAVVVFSDHPRACRKIAKTLRKKKYKVGIITGAIPAEKRQGIVDEFQKGKLDALCCTIRSSGVGYNMTVASDMVLNDRAWVPGDNHQAIKRFHRIGQKRKCTVHVMRGGAISEMIDNVVLKKEDVIGRVL